MEKQPQAAKTPQTTHPMSQKNSTQEFQQKAKGSFDTAMGIDPAKRKEIDAFEAIRKTRRFLEWLDPANKLEGSHLTAFDKASPAQKAEIRTNIEKEYGKSIFLLVPSSKANMNKPKAASNPKVKTPEEIIFEKQNAKPKTPEQEELERQTLMKAKGQREA